MYRGSLLLDRENIHSGETTYFYINLTNGKTLKEYYSDKIDSSSQDSVIKIKNESWYEDNLKDYDKYIDQDTIFCYNRQFDIVRYGISFTSSNLNAVKCNRDTDKFSKSSGLGGNGKLKYPIGLLTVNEACLGGFHQN